MKTLSAELAAHYAGETTTLAQCWLVTRSDGKVFGFTSVDIDLLIGGVTYLAATGFTPSAITTSADLAVDNLEVFGFLTSPVITEADLLAGLWDGAIAQVFEVNYKDLTQGQNNLRIGKIGEVRTGRINFHAEVRGLTQQLQQTIGELYQPGCRADLYDTRCTVVAADYTATGTVVAITSTRQFTTNLPSASVRLGPSTFGAPTANYFQGGKLTWLTGANAGLSMEVNTYALTGGELVLKLGMYHAIAPGDAFTVARGCNHIGRAGDCKLVFNNYVNFRGEEDLPGIDKVMQVGGR